MYVRVSKKIAIGLY